MSNQIIICGSCQKIIYGINFVGDPIGALIPCGYIDWLIHSLVDYCVCVCVCIVLAMFMSPIPAGELGCSLMIFFPSSQHFTKSCIAE